MHFSLNYLPVAVVCRSYRNQTRYVSEACDTENPQTQHIYIPVLSVLVPYASDAVAAVDRRAAVAAITKKSLAIVYATFNFGRYRLNPCAPYYYFSYDFPMREGLETSLLEHFCIIMSYGSIACKSYYRIGFICGQTINPGAKEIIEMFTIAAKSIVKFSEGPTTDAKLIQLGLPHVCDELLYLIRSVHTKQQSSHYNRISWGKYMRNTCILNMYAANPDRIGRIRLEQFGPQTDLWLS